MKGLTRVSYYLVPVSNPLHQVLSHVVFGIDIDEAYEEDEPSQNRSVIAISQRVPQDLALNPPDSPEKKQAFHFVRHCSCQHVREC